MNRISVSPREVKHQRIHQIEFTGCMLVGLEIDGHAFSAFPGLEEALVVPEQLFLSADGPGRYLIFTCACGVADDAGLDGVVVAHGKDTVRWSFSLLQDWEFEFPLDQYQAAVRSCRSKLAETGLPVEPSQVVFPEDWHGSH